METFLSAIEKHSEACAGCAIFIFVALWVLFDGISSVRKEGKK